MINTERKEGVDWLREWLREKALNKRSPHSASMNDIWRAVLTSISSRMSLKRYVNWQVDIFVVVDRIAFLGGNRYKNVLLYWDYVTLVRCNAQSGHSPVNMQIVRTEKNEEKRRSARQREKKESLSSWVKETGNMSDQDRVKSWLTSAKERLMERERRDKLFQIACGFKGFFWNTGAVQTWRLWIARLWKIS